MSRVNDINQIRRAMRGMAMVLHPDTSPSPGNLSALRTYLFDLRTVTSLYNQYNLPSKIYFFKAMSLNGFSNSDIALALTESNNAGQVGNGLRRLADIDSSPFGTTDFFTQSEKQKLTEMIALQRRVTGRTSRRARTSTIAPTRTTATRRTTARAAASRIDESELVRNVKFTGSVGVEFEYFGAKQADLIKAFKDEGIDLQWLQYTHEGTSGWKNVYDGSLSRPNAREVVSRVLYGNKGLVELRKGVRAMQKAGALSAREGSIHVHFGAGDWSIDTWKNLIYNYSNLQPLINKMLNKNRTNNRWAKPIDGINTRIQRDQNISSVSGIICEYLRETGITCTPSNLSDYRSQARYYAINPFSFIKHKTCEFRQHAANFETDTVIAWVLFLHYLIEVSKRKKLSRFDWPNISNFLPKQLFTFWSNRVWDIDTPGAMQRDFNPGETTL